MKNLLTGLLLLLLGLTVACNQAKPAQQAKEETMKEAAAVQEQPAPATDAKPSPARKAQGAIGAATVTINYGSPSVRGRQIWGALVPYGEVWRTGANEATTFEVSKDVMIEGKKLAAGKYGLFTIPTEGKWTIIFNTVPDQWGAYNYDASKDALRVEVSPQMLTEPVEAMEFAVEAGQVVLRWEKLAVPFKVGG